ncbi:MAG: ATP-binding cassette domain-containing protein, partial [Clostridia bacterium]|nr:ATP-binding cassette domain-containing protein [Clostridia bacterium]
IGFIFQQYNLLQKLTVEENVELPLIYAGVPLAKRKEMSKAALERVGLYDRRFHKPTELSGGQQQRASIARALAARPPIILADEPTGALDSKTGTEVLNMLKELHQEGKTVILITHDNKIAHEADRIVRIMDGEIVFDSLVDGDKSQVNV